MRKNDFRPYDGFRPSYPSELPPCGLLPPPCPIACPCPRPYPPEPLVPCPPPIPPRPNPCCCVGPAGPEGRSAYQIAVDQGFIGTEEQWLESLKGDTGPSGPFLSCYAEALAHSQMVETDCDIIFDTESLDLEGEGIIMDSSGRFFTIYRTGLYNVQWTLNLSQGTAVAVVGLLENGDPSSGASTNSHGSFSSSALIAVDQIPFTISLHNYAEMIGIQSHILFEDTAGSIKIFRFADGPAQG